MCIRDSPSGQPGRRARGTTLFRFHTREASGAAGRGSEDRYPPSTNEPAVVGFSPAPGPLASASATGAGVGGSRLSGMAARVWTRVRRPVEMVEATRWLFAVLVLVSLVLALPATVVGANGTMRLVG